MLTDVELRQLQSYEANMDEKIYRRKLDRLANIRPNIKTIQGLANLAHNVQQGLYCTDGNSRGVLGGLIHSSRVEFASRVAPTVLDRTRIDPEYEVGNLNAWLHPKGLHVSLSGPNRNIVWSQGLDSWLTGNRETAHYFPSAQMSPGADLACLDYLTQQLQEMISFHQGQETDQKVLSLAASMSEAVAAEIRSLSQTGESLNKEEVISLLHYPVTLIDLRLTERE